MNADGHGLDCKISTDKIVKANEPEAENES